MTPEQQSQDLKRRMQTMTDQLEIFIKRRNPDHEHEQGALAETLGLIECLRIGDIRIDREELCAALRASALKTFHFSPVITACLEVIADQLDHKKGD